MIQNSLRCRSSHPEMLYKKAALRNFERDFATGVFLRIWRNFKELLFLQNTSSGSLLEVVTANELPVIVINQGVHVLVIS